MAHNCENCGWRKYAERKPDALLSKLWRWHTRWCPGWKRYQRSLADERKQSQHDDPPTADR